MWNTILLLKIIPTILLLEDYYCIGYILFIFGKNSYNRLVRIEKKKKDRQLQVLSQ